MKYILIPLSFLGIILLSFAVERPERISRSLHPAEWSQVSVGSTTISVEVADTPGKRTQGLSGRSALAEGTGMLFVFPEEGDWGFWMKDMHFPIDIIWADSGGDIITIVHDVSPTTYPNAFHPEEPRAKYVLEVPAGFAKKYGIVEGTQIEF